MQTGWTHRWLTKIDKLSVIAAAAGAIAVLGLLIVVAADVVSRHLLNIPLPGVLEITQYLMMPSLISLGLGYALLRGEHIRVTLLTAPSGPRTRKIVEIVSMVCIAGMGISFVHFGFEQAIIATTVGESAITNTWLVIWPARWALVLGLVVLTLQAIAMLIRAWLGPESEPSDDLGDSSGLPVEQEVAKL